MFFSRLSTWRPTHILSAWCVYWLGLVFATVAPALPTLWRVTRPDAHGSANASFGDAGLQLTIVQDAVTVWSRTLPLWTILLWVAVPPLVFWAFWLRAQRQPVREPERP